MINKIANRQELGIENKDFEVIIRENGKIIYQNNTHAGVICLVESLDEFNEEELIFEGVTQAFCFGNPCVQVFAFDQLRQKFSKSPITQLAIKILAKLTNSNKLKPYMDHVCKNNTNFKKKENKKNEAEC
jgi:hypothetical protein